jgi:hypothetical protein
MKLDAMVRMVCVAGLALASVFAQEPPPPPPPGGGGAPGGGAPGGGRGGPGGGRGNWDPAQMQQRFVARIQETLAAQPEEWQVIEPRVTAVFDKQRVLRELQGMRGFRGPQGGQEREQVGPVAALEKAVEGGDAAAIKTALEALRKARTEAEAELAKARQSLREVLSVKQEAQLVLMMGILD